jgi:hypothetical protein
MVITYEYVVLLSSSTTMFAEKHVNKRTLMLINHKVQLKLVLLHCYSQIFMYFCKQID